MTTDCIHRGHQIRLHQCSTCAGNVRTKVFACSKHRECTVGQQIYQLTPGRYMLCGPTCPDIQARNPYVWYYDANPTLME